MVYNNHRARPVNAGSNTDASSAHNERVGFGARSRNMDRVKQKARISWQLLWYSPTLESHRTEETHAWGCQSWEALREIWIGFASQSAKGFRPCLGDDVGDDRMSESWTD